MTDENSTAGGSRLDRALAELAETVAGNAGRIAALAARIDALEAATAAMSDEIVTGRLLVEAHPGGPYVEVAAVDNETEGRFAGVLVDSGDVEQRSVQLVAPAGAAPAVDLRNEDDVLNLQPHPEPRLRLLRRPRGQS